MLLRETGLDANVKLVLDSWENYNESKDPLQWYLKTVILRMKVPKKMSEVGTSLLNMGELLNSGAWNSPWGVRGVVDDLHVGKAVVAPVVTGANDIGLTRVANNNRPRE